MVIFIVVIASLLFASKEWLKAINGLYGLDTQCSLMDDVIVEIWPTSFVLSHTKCYAELIDPKIKIDS